MTCRWKVNSRSKKNIFPSFILTKSISITTVVRIYNNLENNKKKIQAKNLGKHFSTEMFVQFIMYI